MLKISTATISLQGKRSSNQDRVLIAPLDHLSRGGIVGVVADGLGGMRAGDKAAQIAVDTFTEWTDRLLLQMPGNPGDMRKSVLDVCQHANERIRSYAAAHAETGTVATTLVGLIASGSQYLIVNAGDSRCYQISRSGVLQMTEDHTVANSLLRHGALKPADYASSPLRNALTNSLGSNASCEPDIFPKTEYGTITEGCTFLLCSDGFYSELADEDLFTINSDSSLDDGLKALADLALERGTSDNLSAVAIRIRIS